MGSDDQGACARAQPGARSTPDAGPALRAHVAADYAALRELWSIEGDAPSLGLSSADEREAILGFLARNPGLSWGLWLEGRLVGSILVGEDGRRGYLYHAVVHPDRRRQGYGRLLVEASLDALRARGIRKVHVMVYAANREGRDFWRRVGFTPRQELVVLSRETGVGCGGGD